MIALRHLELGSSDHSAIAQSIRSWLFVHTKLYRQNHFRGRTVREKSDRYASTEELVLFSGKPVNANYHEMGRFVDMPLGKCFENAFKISSTDDRWRYTEGWACHDHTIPTHHGWLTGPNGEIEDPTWRGWYMDIMAAKPDEPWTGNAVYWGVSPKRDDHLEWAIRTGHPNILAVYDFDIPEIRKHGLDALTMEYA